MYLSHFGLKKMPFSISPDPDLLWLGEKHSEALASLKYGIYENKGFLALTGNVGTGKTALIYRLIKEIDLPTLVATIPDPGLNSIDFFNLLAEEFNLNARFSTKGEFLIKFKNFLYQAYASDQKVLLIIDEAQRLNHRLLEQIRLLSNIELDNRKLINIFFVGQSEFNKILMMEQNKATRQRLAVRYHIEALSESETVQYIQHRLKLAGSSREIFQPKSIKTIYRISRGYPRIINILCDRCLLTGFQMESCSIGRPIVMECSKELQLPTVGNSQQDNKHGYPPKKVARVKKKTVSKRSRKIKIAVVVAILFVWFAASYFFYESKDGRLISSTLNFGFTGENEYIINQGDRDFSIIDFANTIRHDGSKDFTGNRSIQQIAAKIYFKHNSNQLSFESQRVLDQIAKNVLKYSNYNIIIQGYTDSYGKDAYNKRLSETRAKIVESYFIKKGIAASKLKASGLGSKNPIASNKTSEGRKQNRRVELKIVVNLCDS
jgi:type II secretory pathway predicted ATPase ExeA/outer membrane protein OmpA-like peptidoglycan-associated protein